MDWETGKNAMRCGRYVDNTVCRWKVRYGGAVKRCPGYLEPDFLLFFVIGGLLPHFPLFPMPLPRPLNLALYFDPLVRVPLWKPVPTSFIFCFVFELQYGQKRLTVFGIFITYERKRWFLKFKLGRMALP